MLSSEPAPGVVDRRQWLKALPAIGAGLALSGCGYSLAGRGSFLPAYIRIIGVPMFQNRTPVPTVEQLFTEKVRIEFQGRGRYDVRPDEAGVDGIVRGTLMSIGAMPVGFNSQQLASRYRFTIVLGVQFFDARQQKVLWENPALSFSDEYDLNNSGSSTAAGISVTAFLDQERAAVDRLSADFARSVVSAILEAF